MSPGDFVELTDGRVFKVTKGPDWRDCIEVESEAGERTTIGVSAVRFHEDASKLAEPPHPTDEEIKAALEQFNQHTNPVSEPTAAPEPKAPEAPAAPQPETPHAQP